MSSLNVSCQSIVIIINCRLWQRSINGDDDDDNNDNDDYNEG